MARSIKEIKRRIKGIQSTKQITNAMGLVSSVKLMKANERLNEIRPYYFTVKKNLDQIFDMINEVDYPLLQEREIERTLYIVISDDRGLAGGYNNNIVRLVENEAKGRKKDIDLILVGKKAIDCFDSRGYNILKKFTGITEEPDYSEAENIGNLAFELYKDYQIDEIKVAYARFVNNMTYNSEIIQILPHIKEDNDSEKPLNTIIEFEPSLKEVMDYLLPRYVNSIVYGALIEASCSEQGARRLAMEVATENAKEILEDLQIEYNRTRQSAITTEINEIITGAEALK